MLHIQCICSLYVHSTLLILVLHNRMVDYHFMKHHCMVELMSLKCYYRSRQISIMWIKYVSSYSNIPVFKYNHIIMLSSYK